MLFRSITNKIKDYLKGLIYYDKSKKAFMLSTTLAAAAIDTLIVCLTNGLIYRGIKLAMKILLKSKKIANSFIGTLFNFFFEKQLGRFALWAIVKVCLLIVGRPGAIGTMSGSLFQGFLYNVISLKNVLFQKIGSIVSAFSSVGGFIALFLDLMDGKWDDYLMIKV